MKKPSDELHKLVHSLTTNEKGYFVKFAQRQSESDKTYVQLFNAIQQQEVYNEAVLRKKFKDLAVAKNYLKELILQTLRFFDTDNNSPNKILDKNIAYASILARKGLPKSAEKLIEQSITVAENNDLFGRKAILISMLLDLKMREIPREKKWKFIHDMHNTAAIAIKQNYNITRALFEQRKIYTLIEARRIGNPFRQLLPKIDIEFIISRKNSSSVLEKSVCSNSLGAYYDLKEDAKKMYETFAENLRFNKKMYYPNFNKNEMVRYSAACFNFIGAAIVTKHFTEAKREIANLEKLKVDHVQLRIENIFHLLHAIQELAWSERKFEHGAKETVRLMKQKEIKENLAVFTIMGFTTISNLVLFQFIEGQYKEAFLTIQEFFLLNKTLKNKPLETDTLLLNVLLQFEIGNEDLAYNSAHLLYRSIKTKPKTALYKIVLSLRKFLADRKKNPSTPYPSSLNYEIYNKKLSLNNWLLSKTSGRPLAEIMRESAD